MMHGVVCCMCCAVVQLGYLCISSRAGPVVVLLVAYVCASDEDKAGEEVMGPVVLFIGACYFSNQPDSHVSLTSRTL